VWVIHEKNSQSGKEKTLQMMRSFFILFYLDSSTLAHTITPPISPPPPQAKRAEA